MKRRISRSGSATRAVLIVLFVLMTIPILFVGLAFVGWRTTAVRAQEASVQEARAQQARARELAVQAEVAAQQRIAAEKEIAQESQRIMESSDQHVNVLMNSQPLGNAGPVAQWTPAVPGGGPPGPLTRRVQVVTQAHASPQVGHPFIARTARIQAPLNPDVVRLVNELKGLRPDQEQHEAKLRELRTRLELEFDGMHQRQANEIAETEKRLDSLRQMHARRAENKDKIVQRRVDELLGRSDELSWETAGTPAVAPLSVAPEGFDHVEIDTVPGWPKPGPAPSFDPANALPTPALRPQLGPAPTPPIPPMPPMLPVLPPTPSAAWTSPTSTPPLAFPAPANPDLLLHADGIQLFGSSISPVDPMNTLTTEANASWIDRIVAMAKRQGDALALIQQTERDVETLSRHMDDEDFDEGSLRNVQNRLAQLRREFELSEIQLEAIQKSLQSAQQVLKMQLKSAEQIQSMIKSRVDAGQVGTDELVKREGELRVLQQKLVEAQANLELLERVRSVVRPELEDQAEKTDQPDQSDETDQTDP